MEKKSNAVSEAKAQVEYQLVELKKRQRRLELIAQVTDYAAELPGQEKKYSDVAEEVACLFARFASKVMTQVEGGRELNSSTKNGPKQKDVRQVTTPKPDANSEVADKVKFLMANRHLEKQKVKGKTETGQDVKGVVVGLDAPYVVIHTEDNQTVKIKPSGVREVG